MKSAHGVARARPPPKENFHARAGVCSVCVCVSLYVRVCTWRTWVLSARASSKSRPHSSQRSASRSAVAFVAAVASAAVGVCAVRCGGSLAWRWRSGVHGRVSPRRKGGASWVAKVSVVDSGGERLRNDLVESLWFVSDLGVSLACSTKAMYGFLLDAAASVQ